jgi:hypothetical protein
MHRIKEVLETHEWSAAREEEDEDADADNDLDFFKSSGDHGTGFSLEVNQLEREMMGLRFAIQNGGAAGDEEDDQNDEVQVEELEALMLRMRAIKGRLPLKTFRSVVLMVFWS